MATATINDQFLQIQNLDQLSEQQRIQLWQVISTLPGNALNVNTTQPSLVQQTPRSMSLNASDIASIPTMFGSMDRVQSAPAPEMIRSISASSASNIPNLQRSSSTQSNWQSADDQSSVYGLYSNSAAARKQPSLQPIAETSIFPSNDVIEYNPDEFVNMTYLEPQGSSFPPAQPANPRRLHVQLTPNAQWSPALDFSASPSTPALMTPVTQSSTMSRQSSLNTQFPEEVAMLRVHSDSSMYSNIPADGGFPISCNDPKSISNSLDDPHFFNFTGLSNEDFLSSSAPVSSGASTLNITKTEPCLAENMRRSVSSSSESIASNASASSTTSRQSQRKREIAHAASRPLAMKEGPANDKTKSSLSAVQMKRIRSEDGTSRIVSAIPKTTYVRPQHPKIQCSQCNIRPEGFRGTHELERHVQRAHALSRKGYICIDYWADKKFLSNCKHCRNQKVYGAYYNAAAHLRRAHFHPRKRGRKSKGDQKRGGIGGGDDPPMDYLKQHWIKEIEVDNKPEPPSPESTDSGEPNDNNAYDADVMYPGYPSTNETPTIDFDPFPDHRMCMNASENIYDPSVVYSNDDVSNFQFDAAPVYGY